MTSWKTASASAYRPAGKGVLALLAAGQEPVPGADFSQAFCQAGGEGGPGARSLVRPNS